MKLNPRYSLVRHILAIFFAILLLSACTKRGEEFPQDEGTHSIVGLTVTATPAELSSDLVEPTATPTELSNDFVEPTVSNPMNVSTEYQGLLSRHEVSFDSVVEQIEWVALGGGQGGGGCICADSTPKIVGTSDVFLFDQVRWYICGFDIGNVSIILADSDDIELVDKDLEISGGFANKNPCATFVFSFPYDMKLGGYRISVTDGVTDVEAQFDLRPPTEPSIMLNDHYRGGMEQYIEVDTGSTLSIQYAGFEPYEEIPVLLYQSNLSWLVSNFGTGYAGEVVASWTMLLDERGTGIENVIINEEDPPGHYFIVAQSSQPSCKFGTNMEKQDGDVSTAACSTAASFAIKSDTGESLYLSDNIILRDQDSARLVYVPAGEFSMGSDVGNESDPIHQVYLDRYWIDMDEVTNGRFQQFVQATGYKTTAELEGNGRVWSGDDWAYVNGANWKTPQGPSSNYDISSPVVQVSWFDAVEYCKWVGGRLPTEAEWEKAARGTDNRIYPWGDSVSDHLFNICDSECPANWKDISLRDGYSFLAPTHAFPYGDSPYGASDMAGNVWEWVSDWYDEAYYASSPAQNPEGPSTGEYRVLRGGSWGSDAIEARTFARFWGNPNRRDDDIGFRCVVDNP